jgi:hypothetical protein
VREQEFSRRGEGESAGAAVDQPLAQLLLQCPNLLGDCRLREAQSLRGP